MPLDRALDSLRRDDRATGLAALLEAWGRTRHPRIADVIDAITQQHLDAAPDPGIALRRTTGSDQWDERFEANDVLDLGHLFHWLRAPNDPDKGIHGLDLLAARTRALLGRPPDPRVTKHLVRFLVDQTEGGPHQRSRIVACVDGAAAPLTHLRDVRFTVAIEHLGTRPIAGLLAEKPPSIVAALVELRAAEPSELDAAEWESLRRIEDLVAGAVTHQGAPSIRDLFEAVWADPSSNEPRHVLADRLQEAGDPRGDFIALQLARDGKKKRASFEETSLLEQHGFAWRGALRCEQSNGRSSAGGSSTRSTSDTNRRSAFPSTRGAGMAWAARASGRRSSACRYGRTPSFTRAGCSTRGGSFRCDTSRTSAWKTHRSAPGGPAAMDLVRDRPSSDGRVAEDGRARPPAGVAEHDAPAADADHAEPRP